MIILFGNLIIIYETMLFQSDSQIDAAMPSEYLQAYKLQMANRQNGNSSDKELIDISSDDDQAKIDTTAPKTPQQQCQRENMDIEHVAKRPHLDRSTASTPKTMTHMVICFLFFT